MPLQQPNLPQQMNLPQPSEISLKDCTKHELEVLKFELETFFQMKLYQVFLGVCSSTKEVILDNVLGTTLRGIETLFTREGVMGEAQCWKNVQSVFLELLEDITTEINTRK